jgi:hypothetical protein
VHGAPLSPAVVLVRTVSLSCDDSRFPGFDSSFGWVHAWCPGRLGYPLRGKILERSDDG